MKKTSEIHTSKTTASEVRSLLALFVVNRVFQNDYYQNPKLKNPKEKTYSNLKFLDWSISLEQRTFFQPGTPSILNQAAGTS